MRVDFSIAIFDGQPVVLEQRPELPLIIHTFDSAADALAFYESQSDEPFDSQRRADIVARLNGLAGTPAPESVQ